MKVWIVTLEFREPAIHYGYHSQIPANKALREIKEKLESIALEKNVDFRLSLVEFKPNPNRKMRMKLIRGGK